MMEQNQLEASVVPDDSGEDRAPIGGKALGFGLDFAITLDPAAIDSKMGAGSIWWGGAAGTWFWIDPKNDLFFLGMIQKFGDGTAGARALNEKSASLVYSALTDPTK